LFTSLDDAREYIASELDRAADEMFDTELDNARLEYSDIEQYEANYPEAHELSTSVSGTAELVRHDRDGDVTWQAMRGEWSSHEPDGYVYFIGRI
jgi:pterin-4a-carbinolamine dehydratase